MGEEEEEEEEEEKDWHLRTAPCLRRSSADIMLPLTTTTLALLCRTTNTLPKSDGKEVLLSDVARLVAGQSIDRSKSTFEGCLNSGFLNSKFIQIQRNYATLQHERAACAVLHDVGAAVVAATAQQPQQP